MPRRGNSYNSLRLYGKSQESCAFGTQSACLYQFGAARLGMTGDGVAPVTLELVDSPPVDPQNSFSVTASRKGDRVRAAQSDRLVVKQLAVLHTPVAAQ